jgi:energy-coupling factor transport system substrate-specific component
MNRQLFLKKRLFLAAMLCAMAVVIGYLFVYVPNVEFISATVFIAGYLLGRLYGTIAGMVAEFLFSLLNPMGAAAPPLLLAQVMSFGIIGFMGGVVRERDWHSFLPIARLVYFGALGFFLTLIYDIMTTLSFALFMAGTDFKKITAVFLTGIGFYAIHLVGNTIIFALIVPLILERLEKIVQLN